MPADVIEHYHLNKIATPDGHVYCEIQKGMYGPPQAGIIAHELLEDLASSHKKLAVRTMVAHGTCILKVSSLVVMKI